MIYTTPINSENHPITGKNSLNNRKKEYDFQFYIRIVSRLSVEQLTVFGTFVLSQPFLVYVEFFSLGLKRKKERKKK